MGLWGGNLLWGPEVACPRLFLACARRGIAAGPRYVIIRVVLYEGPAEGVPGSCRLFLVILVPLASF